MLELRYANAVLSGIYRCITLILATSVSGCAFTVNTMRHILIVESYVAGGSAAEVELAVMIPLERALHRFPGLKSMRSNSADGGVSRTELEYDTSLSMQDQISHTKAVVRAIWDASSSMMREPTIQLGCATIQ